MNMSWILLALVTAILYFILSFVLGIALTAITLVMPFLVVIVKILGVFLGAVAFAIAFVIASSLLGSKVMIGIVKLVWYAFLFNIAFTLLGWMIAPLAALLEFLFPFICVYLLLKMIF